MSVLQLQCPYCDGELLADLGSMVIESAHIKGKFKITCSHCSNNFPLGYVSKYKKIEEEAEATSTEPSEEASGGGIRLGQSTSPNASNDQRSNSMNPNNPAFQAANDNHSNQMNPNNSAYHSSRR